MTPQVFTFGGYFPVNSFGLMVALALMACVIRVQRSFENNSINPAYAERYVFISGIVGIIGARLLHLIENWSEVREDLLAAIFSSAGFTFYGGFILAALVMLGLAWKDGLQLSKFADSTGPAIALGYGIGRLGCQLSGDGDYGRAVNNFLGMSYGTGVVPTPPGVLVYPTPLYESAICMLIVLFLLRIETKSSWSNVPLKRFGMAMILLSIERFSVEFLRINPRFNLGFSEAQWIAVVLACVGVVLVSRRAKLTH